ncbi:hypothetical protein, partial [Bradyrhizobium sp. CCBAU 45394]|uniref:hypothetical protein n=1 Tax=Bradyrhizobium sp. CCBAU 45394 TaxID=1325087 RepID=UPI0023028558
ALIRTVRESCTLHQMCGRTPDCRAFPSRSTRYKPDRRDVLGARDHTLLLYLYNAPTRPHD